MTTEATLQAPAEATPSAASATHADDAHPQSLPQGEQEHQEQQPEGEPKADDPAAAARKVHDATQRRINRLVGERAQERARREQAEQERETLRQKLAQYEQPAEGERPAPRQFGPEDVRREATALLEQQKFNDQCNAVVAKGRAAFPDFDASLATLTTVTGPLLSEQGRPEPLLAAVLDGADEPHKVLKHLAANPDVAADLIDLSPRKQAARIALLERDLKTPARQPSGAPLPLTPVKSGADTSGEPDPSNARAWNDWYDKTHPRGRRR